MGRFESTRTEPYEQETILFREVIDVWAKRDGVSARRIFSTLEYLGRSSSWARERYYGRAKTESTDTQYVRMVSLGADANKDDQQLASDQLEIYKKVIADMCRSCASGGSEDQPLKCWDALCALRPVSPLPLQKKARREPPLSAED
jgi:hypothetical protein